MRFGEFDLIKNVFAPLCVDDRAFGLLDDAAVIAPKEGLETVISTDTLVEGVHFLAYEKPEIIARRLLRVNLSDMASMAAKPNGYFLNLTLSSEIDDDWITAFAEGLRCDQEEFGITLLGGDTTHTPGPLTLSVTMLGDIPAGKAVLRSTAMVGDAIFVSGTVGDAALGLLHFQKTRDTSHRLVSRYQLPEPRIQLGQALRYIATAMIDVSDGLVADLEHICDGSGVGAKIFIDDIPVSDEVQVIVESGLAKLKDLIVTGDDYELIFTAPEERSKEIVSFAETAEVAVTKIGVLDGKPGAVKIIDSKGSAINVDRTGYTHF